MEKIIYLDNAATTPVYPEVAKEMQRYMLEEYGNPSSIHSMGEGTQKALENAKKIIASEIGAKPWEIIFTSGGTESNNLALQGVAKSNHSKKKIIISKIEHSSIYELCYEMKEYGYKIGTSAEYSEEEYSEEEYNEEDKLDKLVNDQIDEYFNDQIKEFINIQENNEQIKELINIQETEVIEFQDEIILKN